MTDRELIDQLLDKSLNGETTEEEKVQLQELSVSSDELMDYYFSAVDQQLSLKQHFENEMPRQEKTVPKKSRPIKFPWKIIIASAAILTAMFILTFNNKPISKVAALSISKESYGIALIRNQQEIENPFQTDLNNMDLIQVQEDGELWLAMEDGSRLFAEGGSQLKIQHEVSEQFLLLEGSVSGDVKPQKNPVSFLTKDSEIKVIGTKFKVTIEKSLSQLSVTKGLVQLTRLKDGKTVDVPAGKRTDSKSLKLTAIPANSPSIFPARENGVEYRYYQSRNSLTDLKGNLIDSGITNSLKIKRGDHEGYVRKLHDTHSYVALENFTVELKSFIEIDLAGKYSFRLDGKYESSLEIAGHTVTIPKEGGSEVVKLQLTAGFYPVRILTRGIPEPDNADWAVRVQYYKPGSNSFSDIHSDKLLYSNRQPNRRIFTDDNIRTQLTAHLPLKGNFKDTVNGREATPQGNPQFDEDSQAGTVASFDGINDMLAYSPVDQLGMTADYTASCWVKLKEGGHYDQVIFSNSPQGPQNSTLVLMARRMHPYLAHLNNDTIAGEKLDHGKWTHLTFRFHAGQQSIFINGELAVSSNNHSNLNTNKPLIIGAWSKRYLKGKLSDLRIYKAALHRDDIKLLFDKTKISP